MCKTHYLRWRKNGDPGPAEIKEYRSGRACAIEDCGKASYARGLCTTHYQRWRAGRAVGTMPVRAEQPGCLAAECDRLAVARGWCAAHYERHRRGDDDPDGAPIQLRPYSEEREPHYRTAHGQVWRVRGSASGYSCQHCGGDAQDWAYDHGDPDAVTVLWDEGKRQRQLTFSLDPQHYLALCRPCHRKFDKASG
jgi:hypothetical protein